MPLDRLRTYDINLSAGVDFPVNTDGNVFFIHTSSSVLTVTFDSENVFKSQRKGAKINFDKPYSRFVLNSAATQAVRLVCGFGDFDNTVEQVLAILVLSDGIDTVDDITVTNSATQIVGANSARREVGITIDETATNGIRIGDASVTATSGMLLLPGVSAFIATTAAIYGISTTASSVTASVTELS